MFKAFIKIKNIRRRNDRPSDAGFKNIKSLKINKLIYQILNKSWIKT